MFRDDDLEPAVSLSHKMFYLPGLIVPKAVHRSWSTLFSLLQGLIHRPIMNTLVRTTCSPPMAVSFSDPVTSNGHVLLLLDRPGSLRTTAMDALAPGTEFMHTSSRVSIHGFNNHHACFPEQVEGMIRTQQLHSSVPARNRGILSFSKQGVRYMNQAAFPIPVIFGSYLGHVHSFLKILFVAERQRMGQDTWLLIFGGLRTMKQHQLKVFEQSSY